MRAWSRTSVLVPLVVLCCGFITPAWAQSHAIVQGQVVAAADGSALPAVTVTLQTPGGESRQATTDAAGRFAFTQVIPGRCVISISLMGFDPRTLSVELAPREVRALTVPLDLERFNVNVGVTADLRSLPSTHSPSSTLLTAERLDDMPLAQRTNLSDAIVTAAPGMWP